MVLIFLVLMFELCNQHGRTLRDRILKELEVVNNLSFIGWGLVFCWFGFSSARIISIEMICRQFVLECFQMPD